MPRPPKPRALLRLQEVLEFCFPPGVEHPKAAARLFLLCEFGPLIDGWLWGGAYNARRKLSEYEIETMVTKLEREDIINAVKPEEHGRSSMLPPTPEEEDEVLAGVPESMKKPFMLRRPDIVALLAPCASSPEPEVLPPEPDERIAPVEAYVRAYLGPLLAALNAEDGTPSPTEEFEAALVAYLNAKTPEDEGGERRGEVDAETLAAYDAVEIDGAKLARAVVSQLPPELAEPEEEGGEQGKPTGNLAAASGADAEAQLSAILSSLWSVYHDDPRKPDPYDIEKAVCIYRRDDASPEPEPPPAPEMPVANLFDKSGALDLSVVEQVWLCFHETQRTASAVRAQRVIDLRRMGESSMGLSRRKAVDQGEVFRKGDHRTMSRDRKVEDVAAVNRADRTATKLRTIYNNELQQVEPYRKAKMLHAHTFKITNCMPEHGPTHEGNHPGILQNTVLVDTFRTYPYFEMRTQTGKLPMQTPEVLPGGEWVKAKPWDQTATVTETLRKSYVKSRNTGRTQKVNGIDGNVGGLLPD